MSALVVVPCMRGQRLLPAASLRVGQRVRARLQPWSAAEARYGNWKRYDDTEEYDLPQRWAESVDPR